MHARVLHFKIQAGKLQDFQSAAESVRPQIRRQRGFRAIVVLQTAERPQPEATVISVWDSFEDLKTSEKNMFLYQALSRVLGFCDGFPTIREHEVLVSEFAAD